MRVDFSKYQGLGNDFLLVFEQEVNAAIAQRMCDRHFGIGADGVIEIGRSSAADFSFKLFNADGSIAEISGNGLRCVGKFVNDKKLHSGESVKIEAAGEVRLLDLISTDGVVVAVKAEMGVARHEGEINLQGLVWRRVNTGNPHAVTFVDDIERAPTETVGPLVEIDRAFPARTNVEFVEIRGNELFVRFWERGVGVTLASGSGSCAAVVASGLPAATVHTLGGDLFIENAASGALVMTGPAAFVFDGVIEL